MNRSNVGTLERWNAGISLRRELRFALLAAMETCWVYSVLTFLASMLGFARAISPLSLFAAYWIALVVGRVLPRRKARWWIESGPAARVWAGSTRPPAWGRNSPPARKRAG